MTVNLRRHRRMRADTRGRTWAVGSYRRDRKAMHTYTVRLDGIDVTTRTFFVDGRRGIVKMFKHDATGRTYIDAATGEPAQEMRRGHVELRRKRIGVAS